VTDTTELTPREIKSRLDEYVVGQDKAKRAVAVALRNRWRRRQLPAELQQDVYPKNILLIGPTGVGKTEISRRLASLARAPFVKVEASKYSEVGYHGRDVESMIRDLVDAAVALVSQEKQEEVRERATANANERIFHALCMERGLGLHDDGLRGGLTAAGLWAPAPGTAVDPDDAAAVDDTAAARTVARDKLRMAFDAGELDADLFEIEVLDTKVPTLNITGPQGNDAMGIDTQALQEMWGRSTGPKTKIRKLTVTEARSILQGEEAQKLLDEDAVVKEALERTQSGGIVFLDEIDKVISSGHSDGPDVSREGVQRDLLPVVEGCAVYTRYGHVRTDHILFVAAGAFHFHKPSELIPELQGRFPVRVALQPLTEADFVRILTEPRNSLIRQYEALFSTENVVLTFSRDGVERLAELAFRANQNTQDIGARRLMTILEKCLEGLSFEAAERSGEQITVDAAMVNDQLGETADDEDLIRYNM